MTTNYAVHVTGGVEQGANTLLFYVCIWSYHIPSINEVEKGFWFVVESFSIRWVSIKNIYLSYIDTVKTKFESVAYWVSLWQL